MCCSAVVLIPVVTCLVMPPCPCPLPRCDWRWQQGCDSSQPVRDPTANHPGTDFEGEWYRHGAVFKKLGLTHDAVHVIWHAFHKMDKEKKGYVNYYNFLMYYGTRMPW